jgi:hypothetical protein
VSPCGKLISNLKQSSVLTESDRQGASQVSFLIYCLVSARLIEVTVKTLAIRNTHEHAMVGRRHEKKDGIKAKLVEDVKLREFIEVRSLFD